MGVDGTLTRKREKGGVMKCLFSLEHLTGSEATQSTSTPSTISKEPSSFSSPEAYNFLNQIGIYWSYILFSGLIQ